MTAVMGIDPSLAAFAWATCSEEPSGHLAIAEDLLRTAPSGNRVRARVERYEAIVEPLVQGASAQGVSIVVIEGYSYASAGGKVSGHAHDRAELGGILRRDLLKVAGVAEIYEVAPSSLKKFATGSGKADKAEVISALSQRYKRTFRTDDAADAFACLQVAMCIAGLSGPDNRAQQEVVALVCGRPMPKLTKKQRDAGAQGSLLS
jgi:crossover junction endodeoxyribonuclease RuvC